MEDVTQDEFPHTQSKWLTCTMLFSTVGNTIEPCNNQSLTYIQNGSYRAGKFEITLCLDGTMATQLTAALVSSNSKLSTHSQSTHAIQQAQECEEIPAAMPHEADTHALNTSEYPALERYNADNNKKIYHIFM